MRTCLDGSLRLLTGILSCAWRRANQAAAIVVAPENANEAAAVSGLEVYAPVNEQCLGWLFDPSRLQPHQHQRIDTTPDDRPISVIFVVKAWRNVP